MASDQQVKTAKQPRIFVVFRNDDPSGVSDLEHERKIYEIFERFGARQTIAVIPEATLGDTMDPDSKGERPLFENPEMLALLKEHVRKTGSEIALHGLTHRVNRFSLPERKEFSEFKYLPLDEQVAMIQRGAKILEQCFGERPATFVPPWNRWDENTVEACLRNGLRIISAGPHVTQFNGLTSVGFNTDFYRFHEVLKEAKQSSGPVFLTLLFHSNTLTPQQVELLTKSIETASFDEDCEIVTIKELAQRFPAELQLANEAGRNIGPPYHVPNWIGARAWPYIAVFQKVFRIRAVENLIEKAKQFYFRGDYAACKGLTKNLNQVCETIAWTGRIGAVVAGVAVALSVLLLANVLHLSATQKSALVMAVIVAEILAWSVIVHRTIARDSRRELTVAGIATAIGSFLGVGFAAFL